jgi:hypothetical protein
MTPQPDIYDPSATLKHYSRMARQFRDAIAGTTLRLGMERLAARDAGIPDPAPEEQAHDPAVVAGAAGNTVLEHLAEMAELLAQGHKTGDVAIYSRAIGPHVVREKAPGYLKDGPEPQLVLTKSKAADNYMECRAYEEFRKLVTLFAQAQADSAATFDHPVLKGLVHEPLRAFFAEGRKTLDAVAGKLDRDIDWLKNHDPDTRPLTPADYTPL